LGWCLRSWFVWGEMSGYTAELPIGRRRRTAGIASSPTSGCRMVHSGIRHEPGCPSETLGLLTGGFPNILSECRVRKSPRQHHAPNAKCGQDQRCLVRVRPPLFEACFERANHRCQQCLLGCSHLWVGCERHRRGGQSWDTGHPDHPDAAEISIRRSSETPFRGRVFEIDACGLALRGLCGGKQSRRGVPQYLACRCSEDAGRRTAGGRGTSGTPDRRGRQACRGKIRRRAQRSAFEVTGWPLSYGHLCRS
jgi:hypothetical protein